MKKVTFTAHCAGLGAVYNKGDVAVFPDEVADAIVAAKKGTAQPVAEKTAPASKQPGSGSDKPPVSGKEDGAAGDNKPETSENGTS
ncbi:hypothetical protein HK16_00435 [Acetobacter senegalensis]|uniref:Uncharacterized protein n=2 Tax=Acetobacter TaxID=434 RepID=A0A252EER2_9PROT|nr:MULTISPECIES: hypothetical protein [Acetobacter]ATJ90726.1 hypothetical protein CIW82_08515 [Acetobacter tropicalis]OUL64907.1 hypothetical protein HK16_00435 [Acetobacter senegalensis]